MPTLLKNLVIDRVDLVDEGANSAAFIELYKRKGLSEPMDVQEILSKMKPEHSEVIQAAIDAAASSVTKANEELASVTAARDTATEELAKVAAERDGLKAELDVLKSLENATCTCDGEADADGKCKVCGKPKLRKEAGDNISFDEDEVMKSLPEPARKMLETLRVQKDAAEESLRKAKEAEQTAEAVAKANTLKALPIEHDKLVGIVKTASAEVLELLTTANAAIEGTVLDEVGKSHTSGSGSDAWSKIDAKAEELTASKNITKAKAITQVIKENPELYKEYLQGGAN